MWRLDSWQIKAESFFQTHLIRFEKVRLIEQRTDEPLPYLLSSFWGNR